MRKILALLLLPTLLLAACGGGGSGSGSSTSTSGSSGSSSTAATNMVTMTVDGGPAALQDLNPPQISLNTAYVSVQVCVPGSTTQCQTIDHVQVDTGSYGFRVISSVLSASMYAALPPQMNSTNNQPVSECVEFADGYTFGPVVTADLQIGGETAASIPIHLMGSNTTPAPSSFVVPSDCVSGAMGQPEEDTVGDFGANGVLGIGVFIQDCGPGCASTPIQPQAYYTCSNAGNCTNSVQPLAQQVSNPVASFPTDNNGVALQLPSIGDTGASNVNGTLVFGLGTQSNNMVASGVAVLTADLELGNFTTTYNGATLNQSILDSGSNAYFFPDNSIAQCPTGTDAVAPGFYCPTSTLSLSATNVGNNEDGTAGTGPTSTVNFTIGNAVNLFQSNSEPTALNNVGGTLSTLNNSFDFGLSFFYGRTVYVALQDANTTAGPGPYYAY